MPQDNATAQIPSKRKTTKQKHNNGLTVLETCSRTPRGTSGLNLTLTIVGNLKQEKGRRTACQTQSEAPEQPRLPVSSDSADVCWQVRDLQPVSPASAQLTCRSGDSPSALRDGIGGRMTKSKGLSHRGGLRPIRPEVLGGFGSGEGGLLPPFRVGNQSEAGVTGRSLLPTSSAGPQPADSAVTG